MSSIASRRAIALSAITLMIVAGCLLWALAGAPGASAQDGTPTPVPTATPEPTATPVPPTPSPTPTPTITPEPTWTPGPTWTPEPTNTPLPTNSPVPTPTPLPTNTPAPTSTPVPVVPQEAPGGAIFINCGPGEPCIDLHSSHTDISVDERAVLSFSIVNSLGKPDMLTRLILDLPSGWSMDGEGFADKCSGLCSANYNVATGEQRFIEVTAYPNHSGTFRLEGRMEWTYAGTSEILHLTRDVQIKVKAGAIGNANRVEPLPTSPPQPVVAVAIAPPPPPAPTAVAPPAPAAPATPEVGVTGGVGCFTPSPNATAIDPSLLLVAGLILPGLAAKLGLRARQRRKQPNP